MLRYAVVVTALNAFLVSAGLSASDVVRLEAQADDSSVLSGCAVAGGINTAQLEALSGACAEQQTLVPCVARYAGGMVEAGTLDSESKDRLLKCLSDELEPEGS